MHLSLLIVPVKLNFNKFLSFFVQGYIVMSFEGFDEVIKIFVFNSFDSEIVHDEHELYIPRFMFPQVGY